MVSFIHFYHSFYFYLFFGKNLVDKNELFFFNFVEKKVYTKKNSKSSSVSTFLRI